MTAPKVIRTNANGTALVTEFWQWETDVRYIRADAPELVKLENALQWIALGPAYDQKPQEAVLAMMKLAADAIAAWEAVK